MITGIEKRVTALEGRISISSDHLDVLALDILTDSELGILEEYLGLYHAGFTPDEMRDMMAPDIYNHALSIWQMVETEYGRLLSGRNYNHVTIRPEYIPEEEGEEGEELCPC